VTLSLAVIAPFLDEETHLPRFLASVERQTSPADVLVLVDDGSRDRSAELAAAVCERVTYIRLLRRPPRPSEADRLQRASEYAAFQWAAARLERPYDIVAKVDTDLELTPRLFEDIRTRMAADARLGIAGGFLSAVGAAGRRREHCPPYHVRGAVKFYRRQCLAEISPVEAILGWDGIDEYRARMLGWRTRSFATPGGDTLHLRPMGAHGGRLRHERRLGMCDWAIGYHPLWVGLRAMRALRHRPPGMAALAYLSGWAGAGVVRRPRAHDSVRAYVRREQLGRIRGRRRA
jgi:poly-beta-1,6-N-acetyl-D-glucosamine synthase